MTPLEFLKLTVDHFADNRFLIFKPLAGPLSNIPSALIVPELSPIYAYLV